MNKKVYFMPLLASSYFQGCATAFMKIIFMLKISCLKYGCKKFKGVSHPNSHTSRSKNLKSRSTSILLCSLTVQSSELEMSPSPSMSQMSKRNLNFLALSTFFMVNIARPFTNQSGRQLVLTRFYRGEKLLLTLTEISQVTN